MTCNQGQHCSLCSGAQQRPPSFTGAGILVKGSIRRADGSRVLILNREGSRGYRVHLSQGCLSRVLGRTETCHAL